MATKKKLKKFRVHTSWECSGWVIVEAETQEEAENSQEGDDVPLPENGDYVGGSCQVDREFTEKL